MNLVKLPKLKINQRYNSYLLDRSQAKISNREIWFQDREDVYVSTDLFWYLV